MHVTSDLLRKSTDQKPDDYSYEHDADFAVFSLAGSDGAVVLDRVDHRASGRVQVQYQTDYQNQINHERQVNLYSLQVQQYYYLQVNNSIISPYQTSEATCAAKITKPMVIL